MSTAEIQKYGGFTPFSYQEEFVQWISSERKSECGRFTAPPLVGLAGDEMGLGKTAELLLALRERIQAGKTYLFIVPGATMVQWQKSFDRWIYDNTLNGDDDDFGFMPLYALRSSDGFIPRGCSILISHAMLGRKSVVDNLLNVPFDGIVIDEIHKFGAINMDGSAGSKRVKHLWVLINVGKIGDVRLAASGTPTRNYAREIYNVCHFLDPMNFRVYKDFQREYLTWDGKALSQPHKFHSHFAPYYIRRTVNQVQKDLPEIRRTKLYTEITDPNVKIFYNAQVDMMSNLMNNGEKLDQFSLLGYLQKLRHITGIAKAKEPSIIEPIRDYLLGEESCNKVVIGLHHHLVQDRLKTSLPEFDSVSIVGGMTDVEKYNMIQKFRDMEAPAIGYLSIKAAGEGIDGLQYAARKAYVFERQWNGADELQFEKRLHRTGQTSSVEIEYPIAVGTVEEFFDEMVEMKRRITTQVEDQNWESNPAFLRELAERVISKRLK